MRAGGKPDPGETPLETLAGELREELGVSLVECSPLGASSPEGFEIGHAVE